MALCPMTLPEANAYVERNHRHSVPTVGHKFSVGAEVGGEVERQERFRWEVAV